MLPPSCARCGAPLPAVAADPTHPEWCAACAARALDTPGTVPPPVPAVVARPTQATWPGAATAPTAPTGASLVVKTRPFDGILTGLAAATLGGLLWWAGATLLAANTDFRQWHLGSIVVGLLVGQGVLIGSRRGGLVSGLLALVFSTVAALVAVYFIDRSIGIIALQDAGRSSDVPLWLGFSNAKDLYQGYVDYERAKAGQWLLAPFLAVVIAGWPGRRPLVG